MAVKAFGSVCHRCGTCGTIFPTLAALNMHVASGHSTDDAQDGDDSSYPAPSPHGGVPLALHARYAGRLVMQSRGR